MKGVWDFQDKGATPQFLWKCKIHYLEKKKKKINTSEDEFNTGMEAKHIMACC